MGYAISGLVLTKESYQEESPPLHIGEVINYRGTDHIVTGLKGTYNIEMDRWEVTAKLAALRGKTIHESEHSETPEWVKEAVGVE